MIEDSKKAKLIEKNGFRNVIDQHGFKQGLRKQGTRRKPEKFFLCFSWKSHAVTEGGAS